MKIFGIVGWKNSGKTGLMERLVSEFSRRGVTVSTIKHAHHEFDVDQPGKDSFRHRTAGAREVVVASAHRFAIMHELRGAPEPSLNDFLAQMSPVDLVLIEGYKSGRHPKIEAHRGETRKDLLARKDTNVLAVASDEIVTVDCPTFDLDDTQSIADFIAAQVGL